jgi:hypothetical protein
MERESAKARNIIQNSSSQLWRNRSNAICKQQVAEDRELRAQQQRRATITQPLQCNLQAPGCRNQKNYVGKIEAPLAKTCSKTGSLRQGRAKYDFESF